MADILSHSTAPTARARAEKETVAAENRVRFGRTRADKQREAAEKALAAGKIDAHKRED